MVWLQEHAGQTASTDASQAPPPCPCLNTPPPLMSPEQLHATQVGAAADEAMMQGMARIRAAAVEAAAPIEAEMENGANMVAKVSADHIRETTEQWAENQARTI